MKARDRSDRSFKYSFPLTMTNSHGWVFIPLGAQAANSSSSLIVCSGIGSLLYLRTLRRDRIASASSIKYISFLLCNYWGHSSEGGVSPFLCLFPSNDKIIVLYL